MRISDMISDVCSSDPFTKYTFHEALNPHMTSGAVGRHVFKSGNRVAFLLADYAYGHAMLRGFRRVGEELGIEEAVEIRHPPGPTAFSTFRSEERRHGKEFVGTGRSRWCTYNYK